jgi:hypothetical protein
MVAGAIAGNISAEATTPTGNTFAEAMRGLRPALIIRAANSTVAKATRALARLVIIALAAASVASK